MSYQKFAYAYIQPQYTTLQPTSKETSANFSKELMIFLSQHPEFTSTKSQFDILRYCYDHYINCDPISKGLPLQEKFKQAGEMAKNFMGIVIGAKG
jgi:hypothetical protein